MKAKNLMSERLDYPDPDEVSLDFHARGWTDGLPIIPPTEARVLAMIETSGHTPGDVIGSIPPRWASATVENIAVNAVMAGCLPAYMPVLVAAVSAVRDPAFRLFNIQSTTHPAGVLLIVNGPIARELDINCRWGIFGPGWIANATIGRALRLILMNVGGGIPGKGDRSTQGSPGKYTYCIAENEEENPWEPLHVERGFRQEDSTVTVFGAESPHNMNDHFCKSDLRVLSQVADVMSTIGSNNACALGEGDLVIVFGPEHAAKVASGGMSKRDVKQYLFENARNPVGKLRETAQWGFYTWPKWIDQEDDSALVPLVEKPDDINIIVAGGPGKHSSFIPTFGVTKSVTRKIGTSGNA